MAKVHVLDDNTINKIAAGEVVERPASVAKELIENAIDAKSTKIQVEIMGGGISFLRVSDNGIGMSRDDAGKAILRHATSKLTEVSDLLTIGTLGFRGEALPSIASVSRFILTTRQQGEELGTSVKIIGGKSPEISDIGCNLGTTVTVEDLFFNTPARKKFLKTNNTEAGKISDFLVKLAISNPQIAFKFINNGKQTISTPGNGNLYDTLQSLYGKTAAEALLPIDFQSEEGDISITGYISKPSTIRSSRNWQSLIVNGRIVVSRSVFKAIDNAYNALVPKSGYPLAVLLVNLPQRNIDVNVHPQKTEMKFADEQLVFKSVYKAVLDAIRPAGKELQQMAAAVEKPRPQYSYQSLDLSEQEINPSISGENVLETRDNSYQTAVFEASPERDKSDELSQVSTSIHNYSSTNNSQLPTTNNSQSTNHNPLPTAHCSLPTTHYPPPTPHSSLPTNHHPLTPIGQVDNCYIIAQDDKGLYIVDQHAAHERILFDRLSNMADKIPSQQLLIHQFMDFDNRECNLIENNMEMFKSLGFGMEPSGRNQYRLMEVPADISVGEAEDVVREILMNLQEMHKASAAELRQKCLATTACKAAIKSGMKLNLRQMQVLLDELENTAMPYTCPHGRPTILKFSSDELAKMFKRTGF